MWSGFQSLECNLQHVEPELVWFCAGFEYVRSTVNLPGKYSDIENAELLHSSGSSERTCKILICQFNSEWRDNSDASRISSPHKTFHSFFLPTPHRTNSDPNPHTFHVPFQIPHGNFLLALYSLDKNGVVPPADPGKRISRIDAVRRSLEFRTRTHGRYVFGPVVRAQTVRECHSGAVEEEGEMFLVAAIEDEV
ncbi:hypothetical protein SISNIDRAFT_498021 [Sistotremastrum niveocremeum HHB9708]|uniref:Uncharacterized protein n=1 Tax=Sistotremastrum niveocremeum HHB9708 TaxID=1314777 RepID=A0A164P782_9AGAM|nr:hypothetical protein SISNIDRAFT_498021 [Sistotremastrum niveocremeum HHB9708]